MRLALDHLTRRAEPRNRATDFGVDKGRYSSSGRVIEHAGMKAKPIRDLNRAMDCNLPGNEANTVAGLVIHEAQTIPSEGPFTAFASRGWPSAKTA